MSKKKTEGTEEASYDNPDEGCDCWDESGNQCGRHSLEEPGRSTRAPTCVADTEVKEVLHAVPSAVAEYDPTDDYIAWVSYKW